jgi:thiamine biosynthesis lipoprotein
MLRYTAAFDAIGVTNSVTVTDADVLPDALEIARTEVAALDDACSRFRPDSELSRLSARGSARVSPLLLEAIETALDAASRSDGLVDPTIGRSMSALGYDRDFDVLVGREPRSSFRLVPASGWRSVSLDRDRSVVSLRPGTELDLGATAKAFAADRIARAAHEATGAGVLVSLGGDIAVAGEAPDEGWPVLVTDDHRSPDAHGQTVSIRDGALATSSTTVRRWRAGGAELHHIVNPSTGAPAPETWRTVSVAAGTCVDANVAATAAILRGHSAIGWLESLGLHARLVRRDGSIARTGGWPAEASFTRDSQTSLAP